jgi:hypothetical protein
MEQMNKIAPFITVEKKTRLLEINRLASKKYYYKNRERVLARVKAYHLRVANSVIAENEKLIQYI